MKFRHRVAFPLASAFALSAASLAAQAPASPAEQPMTAEDLITMPRLGSPTVSAGDRFAVFSVTETDPQTYERSSVLYRRDLQALDEAAVRVDLGGAAYDAKFGGDDWLYFLSDRAGSRAGLQVWRTRMAADGAFAAPVQVTDFDIGVNGYSVAPDGNRIAVWAEIARDCATFGCDGDGMAHRPGPGDGLLYDGEDGFYRHWDEWETPGTISRVFVFALENGIVGGTGTALDGPDGEGALAGDTPTKPFGGAEDIAWASDGRGVFFVAREGGKAEPSSTDLDIYFSDLSAGAPTNLTDENRAVDALPTPSPDGRYLAYVAMARPGYESDRQVVHLRDLATGRVTALTDDFDRSFGSLAWTSDSRWIIATAQSMLDTPAYRIDPRSGAVEVLDLMAGNEAHIGNVIPLSGGDLLFTRDSIGAPAELFVSRDWEQAKPLTNVATTRMGRMAATVTTRFSFAGADGDTVWGQVTKLEDHDGPMPAILYVHGGPQGSFNDGWSSRWNPRVVASQGYAVISIDFHGSTGYGQAFTDSINQDWGGKPLKDLQIGFEVAIAADPQIDGDRACAMGASYGGYMINWMAGQWPDRFRCFVQHDGLFDLRSFYYTTEELWFPKWDFGGSYADNSEVYERWNPVNHVEKWQTPMLVVTGLKDFRVPYTQGLASFTALQERDIPAQLLVFEDENHWVLGAKNSLQWHNTVFNWLDRWLGDE